MNRLKLIIKGNVQGVGFRYQVNEKANRFNITGYTRNLSDGTVLVEAQGEEVDLREFIKNIPESLLFAKVSEIEESPMEIIENEEKFKVKY